MGRRPRARSVLHCHGVLALRRAPWTGACRTKASSKRTWASWELAVKKARKSKVCSCFLVGSETDVWHSGLRAAGPIRPSGPWCFSPAKGSLDWSLPHESQLQEDASKLAVGSQEGTEKQGLQLLSSWFRKWRLAFWGLAVLLVQCYLAWSTGQTQAEAPGPSGQE